MQGGTDYSADPGVPGTRFGVVELGGLKATRIFDPKTNHFTQAENTQNGRWYPTLVPLGRRARCSTSAACASSSSPSTSTSPWIRCETSCRARRSTPQTGHWTGNGKGAERSLPLYPRLHLLPDGKVFYNTAGQSFNPVGQAYDQAELERPGRLRPGQPDVVDGARRDARQQADGVPRLDVLDDADAEARRRRSLSQGAAADRRRRARPDGGDVAGQLPADPRVEDHDDRHVRRRGPHVRPAHGAARPAALVRLGHAAARRRGARDVRRRQGRDRRPRHRARRRRSPSCSIRSRTATARWPARRRRGPTTTPRRCCPRARCSSAATPRSRRCTSTTRRSRAASRRTTAATRRSRSTSRRTCSAARSRRSARRARSGATTRRTACARTCRRRTSTASC